MDRGDLRPGERPAADPRWYTRFYEGLWLEAHRRLRTPADTRTEVQLVERALRLSGAGARVLDVPCGNARHALELARRGYRVTGVDLCEALLAEARARAAAEGLELGLERRDMVDLPWRGAFEGALCLWGSFGYLSEEGNARFLRAIRRALRPGARLVLDTHVAESLLPRLVAPAPPRRLDDLLLESESSYDPLEARTTTRWVVTRGEERFEGCTSIRLYTCREVLALLRAAGFAIEAAWGSPGGVPFALGAERLWVVAVATLPWSHRAHPGPRAGGEVG